MLVPGHWPDYILLVCVWNGRQFLNYISLYSTQEKFMEELPDRTGMRSADISIINIDRISLESFSTVEDSYRESNRVVEA